MTTECAVCMEDTKESSIITCISCKNSSCQKCTRYYLVTTHLGAHCMSCKVGWTDRYLLSVFPKVWVNGTKTGQYRESRKVKSLEREKSQIPASMAGTIENMNIDRERSIYNMKIKRENALQRAESEKINAKIWELEIEIRNPRLLIEERQDRKKKQVALRNEDLSLIFLQEGHTCKYDHKHIISMGPRVDFTDIHVMERNRQPCIVVSGKKAKKVNHYVFASPCPVEECRGLVKNDGFVCSVCDTKMCRKCYTIKEKTHKCLKVDIDTVKLIKNKNTKPCPKCAVPITKISGCDQMWCVVCHTAFSWNTGALETGSIHNPHATRWRAEHELVNHGVPAQNEDILCNIMPPINENMMEAIKNCFISAKGKKWYHERLYNAVGHVDTLIERERPRIIDILEILRVEYILGIIDEKKWKQSIFIYERNKKKKDMIRCILELYRTISIEKWNAFARTQSFSAKALVDELEELRLFINKEIRDIGPEIGVTVSHQLTDEMVWRKIKLIS